MGKKRAGRRGTRLSNLDKHQRITKVTFAGLFEPLELATSSSGFVTERFIAHKDAGCSDKSLPSKLAAYKALRSTIWCAGSAAAKLLSAGFREASKVPVLEETSVPVVNVKSLAPALGS